MRFWFGRKAAPADARPYVPAWLQTRESEGFARSIEGLRAYVRSTGTVATYRGGSWEIGLVRASSVLVSGQQVVGERRSGISNPSGGSVIDSEARAAIDAMLAALRAHGLIDPQN